MGRIVGLTLVGLGAWVLYSVVRYARGGESFRLRSRWMLVFDGVRYSWRQFQARLHGHEHTEPLEMSSYGPRTAFGVGMIHGIGAETGTQVLLIAAVGGAAASGLGFPMLLAFVLGLLISNFAIVVMTSVGFVASQTRERIYVVVGPGRRRVQPRHRDDLPARVRCHPARAELGPALLTLTGEGWKPASQSVGGRPNSGNSAAPNVVISATIPASMRTTSILKARYVSSPGASR